MKEGIKYTARLDGSDDLLDPCEISIELQGRFVVFSLNKVPRLFWDADTGKVQSETGSSAWGATGR